MADEAVGSHEVSTKATPRAADVKEDAERVFRRKSQSRRDDQSHHKKTENVTLKTENETSKSNEHEEKESSKESQIQGKYYTYLLLMYFNETPYSFVILKVTFKFNRTLRQN